MSIVRLTSFLIFSALTLGTAAASDCPTLSDGTQFIGFDGAPAHPGGSETMALQEIDEDKFLVYRRNPRDAEVLVHRLATNGVSDPALLKPDSWLLAQVGKCRDRPGPGGKCIGNCPGKQNCRRIKRPKSGGFKCQCVLFK